MLNSQIQLDFNSFHNTIESVGVERLKFESDAKSQEQLVYELYCSKKVRMAWFEVKGFLGDMNECSIKRCLTNLKTKGMLYKTGFKVLGTQGKPCYQYELKP